MEGSKSISFILSFVITAIASLLLYAFEFVEKGNIVHVALLLLVVLYLSLYLFLDKLIYKHISEIDRVVSESRKKRVEDIELYRNRIQINSFKKLTTKLVKKLYRHQNEIDHLSRLAAFRKEFIADVSHELKTPIFAAQGFIHTLLDGAVDDKEVRTRFLKKAATSVDSLDMLVHDLLTLSNIEIGKTKMQLEYFALNDLISEVVEQLSIRAEKKGILIKIINGKNIPAIVFADWLRIRQVLTNLISNAIKYTDEGGEVEISLENKVENVKVKIKDNGVGIPKEDLKRVFERFYRVDKSRSREKGGTGLGLAIVKHILEGHNSIIEVMSEEGKGSTFEFSLQKGKG